jgi:hypothetical protein
MENNKQDSGEFDTEGEIFQEKGSCNTSGPQRDNDFDTGLVMRDAYGREVRKSSKYKKDDLSQYHQLYFRLAGVTVLNHPGFLVIHLLLQHLRTLLHSQQCLRYNCQLSHLLLQGRVIKLQNIFYMTNHLICKTTYVA